MTDLPEMRRRALNTLRSGCPRGFLLTAALISGLLMGGGVAWRAGLLIGNASPSVPRGLYRAASPQDATYVTFCLGPRHRALPPYQALCSPDSPDSPQVIKRITTRHADGSLSVGGDTPRALDSRFLGPVRPDEIRGWWRPLLTESAMPFRYGTQR